MASKDESAATASDRLKVVRQQLRDALQTMDYTRALEFQREVDRLESLPPRRSAIGSTR
jgi:hypothetical protein